MTRRYWTRRYRSSSKKKRKKSTQKTTRRNRGVFSILDPLRWDSAAYKAHPKRGKTGRAYIQKKYHHTKQASVRRNMLTKMINEGMVLPTTVLDALEGIANGPGSDGRKAAAKADWHVFKRRQVGKKKSTSYRRRRRSSKKKQSKSTLMDLGWNPTDSHTKRRGVLRNVVNRGLMTPNKVLSELSRIGNSTTKNVFRKNSAKADLAHMKGL